MQDTKNTILDVAEDLIQRNGLNAVSYKHISDSIGIKTASIHYHFPQKKDLVNGLLARCNQHYGNQYKKIAENKHTAPQKLLNIAEIFEKGVAEEKVCLLGVLSTDITALDPTSQTTLEMTLEHTISIFASIFTQGAEEETLQFSNSARDTAHAFLSLLIGAQILARVKDGKKSVTTVARTFINGCNRDN